MPPASLNTNHHRRSIRLPGYDYSQPGEYFITLCTHQKRLLFGEIVGEEMVLNTFGNIVVSEWRKTPTIRKEIELGVYQIMPNHFHAILHLYNNEIIGTGDRPVAPTELGQTLTKPVGPKPKSLGALIAGFKSSVTTQINTLRHTPGTALWQRNYYEHIITTDKEYIQIEDYIQNNPANWFLDVEYNNYLKGNPLKK